MKAWQDGLADWNPDIRDPFLAAVARLELEVIVAEHS